jgi:hypothetical protein
MHLSDEQGRALLKLARAAVEREFDGLAIAPWEEEWLREDGATFVTLMLHGDLRGCIGSIEATRPLGEDVQRNAISAALRDPRFPSLSRGELAEVRFEVSLLSAMIPLDVSTEGELLSVLRPMIDGLVIEWGHHRATFLPSVWEQLPQPREFLRHLKRKAGLREDFWAPEMCCWLYGTEKWEE